MIKQGRNATPAVVNPVYGSAQRKKISLNGAWEFAVDPKKVGDRQKWFRSKKPFPGQTTIRVPGCWEAQGIGGPSISVSAASDQQHVPLRGAYVGTAWYRKRVALPRNWDGKQIWLKIGGVHAQGWFWVNGVYLGHDACYCGTYKYNITDLVMPGGEAVVVVKACNDVSSGKGLFSWIQRFGGLYRGVEIEATPAVFIDYAWVDGGGALFDKKSAVAHIQLRASTSVSGQVPAEVSVSVRTLDGKPAGRSAASVLLKAGEIKEVALRLALDPFRPWSPEEPHLYRADIALKLTGRQSDGWCERFGARKWEARGADFYLNNRRYFVRGFGDDFIYPLTICSPADRDAHRKHLRIARDLGFNYVRHHTHCEIPEFYEAADELGIMVQPELPYGNGTGSETRPKEDLVELITHYRRYVSLATYCMGNEGHIGSPLDRTLYRLAKRTDGTRLVLHQDGGHNTPANSDFGTGPDKPWQTASTSRGAPKYKQRSMQQDHELWNATYVENSKCKWEMYSFKQDVTRPWFTHEYLNLAVEHNPRLCRRYTGAQLPPFSANKLVREWKSIGLNRAWCLACCDAGHHLQRIYQKRGLESARLDPACGGYIYWTLVDVCNAGDQGLLDSFWGLKAATPAFYREFNSRTALLARLPSDPPVFAEGDALTVEWWLSCFEPDSLRNRELTWEVVIPASQISSDRGNPLLAGVLNGVHTDNGDVRRIGSTTLRVPAVRQPVHARIRAGIRGTNIANSWDIWLFPKPPSLPDGGRRMSASEDVYHALAPRYPGMKRLGTPEAAATTLILCDRITDDVMRGLEQGKTAILLALPGPNPGHALGWWVTGAQTGTAVARHPAFGKFPHEGRLDELFFRLIGNTFRLTRRNVGQVEPLMAGHGTAGYLAHVFQAKAGKGKILASGLNLLGPHPESAWLLHEFVAYAGSGRCRPRCVFDAAHFMAEREKMDALRRECNGWARAISAPGGGDGREFRGATWLWRLTHADWPPVLRWETGPAPAQPGRSCTFKWLAAFGNEAGSSGVFGLRVNGHEVVSFDAAHTNRTWKSKGGHSVLKYKVERVNDGVSSGVMELTLPSSLLKPAQPAEIYAYVSRRGSHRWFGVYELA